MGLKDRVSDTTQYEILVRTRPEGLREALWEQLRKDIDSKAISNDLLSEGVISYDGKGAGSKLGEPPNELCRGCVCDSKGTAFWDLFILRSCLTSSSARVCIDQEVIAAKSGEATTFPSMLERDVKQFPRLFRYITGDAGLASQTNAQKVLELNKLYLFQIKGNFGRLYPLAESLLDSSPVIAETTERSQGCQVRRELRRVAVPAEVSFPGATQILGVSQIRTKSDGTVETEHRVFITAVPWQELSAAKLLKLVRLHWGIENGANWTADMIFEEDTRSPCYQGYGPIVVSWLLLLAYNIVAVFRAHLPLKDRRPERWERARELIYQAFLSLGIERIRRLVPIV
jgi:predicted transposase YbfD/YdcC